MSSAIGLRPATLPMVHFLDHFDEEFLESAIIPSVDTKMLVIPTRSHVNLRKLFRMSHFMDE
jgi:hypothetical protein